MEQPIHQTIVSEFVDRGVYIVDNFIERVSASIGGHVLNLCNLDHKIFLKNGLPANFRNHIVYIAPSGWTKSTYFRLLLRSGWGIVWNDGKFCATDIHSHFSISSWFGTIDKPKDGEAMVREGVFEGYKRGVIGADDYQALKLLFNGEGTGQDEIALMTALDTDQAQKNLAYGKLVIKNIGMTAWFGMRPTRLNLTSGLARRFSFPRFFPTRKEAGLFRTMARKEIRPNEVLETDEYIPPLLAPMQSTYDLVREVGAEPIETEEVDAWLDGYEIPHFEESIYRNLAIGFSVANGNYPHVVLDDRAKEMLEDEILSREILRTDPYRMMFFRILDDEPDKTIKWSALRYFLKTYLQFQESDADQLIREEKRDGRLSCDGKGRNKTLTLNWVPDYLSGVKEGVNRRG